MSKFLCAVEESASAALEVGIDRFHTLQSLIGPTRTEASRQGLRPQQSVNAKCGGTYPLLLGSVLSRIKLQVGAKAGIDGESVFEVI